MITHIQEKSTKIINIYHEHRCLNALIAICTTILNMEYQSGDLGITHTYLHIAHYRWSNGVIVLWPVCIH